MGMDHAHRVVTVGGTSACARTGDSESGGDVTMCPYWRLREWGNVTMCPYWRLREQKTTHYQNACIGSVTLSG